MRKIRHASSYIAHRLREDLLSCFIRLRDHFRPSRSSTYDCALKSLEINGYFVIENYLTTKECDELALAIKDLTISNSSVVHYADDRRIYGVQNCAPRFKHFILDRLFLKLGSSLVRRQLFCPFAVSGWLQLADSKNGSSGGGWHRDGFSPQFKVMIYLTDVSIHNGPFQLIPRSHRYLSILKQLIAGDIKWDQDRYSDTEIHQVLSSLNENIHTFNASKGTAILFDGSSIHQGSPIFEGERVTVTNYYFPCGTNVKALAKKFSPILELSDPT